jgi:hypothetical protein
MINNNQLLNRLPNFEPSYETFAHKTVPPSYNLGLAIPVGRKYYAWFSFQRGKDVCYLMEINREKKIGKITAIDIPATAAPLAVGTILYGTILESPSPTDIFIIEDIYCYQGTSLAKIPFGEKLGFIHALLTSHTFTTIAFYLPIMWYRDDDNYSQFTAKTAYQIHHIQYRELHKVSPFLNVETQVSRPIESIVQSIAIRTEPKYDFHKPQYRKSTVFSVKADIQFDIYHLYAMSANGTAYYGTAYITNLKTSKFMNALFRNIRENQNLDYIEESDDEDDFQDIKPDKYVDLEKTVLIECSFHPKFKKWMPDHVVETGPIVNMDQLCRN